LSETISFKFENLYFSRKPSIFKIISPKCLNKNEDEKLILNSLSGSIDKQSLVALMGPSGSGKSSLLKCLCNGYQVRGFSGKIFNLGESKACFLTQSEVEHLLMKLTVEESLIFASKLKNISNDIELDHKSNAQNLLRKLGLRICKDVSVYNCSGGQRKRLAIALELTSVKKPDILLLDEPISGLNSLKGLEVCFIIKSEFSTLKKIFLFQRKLNFFHNLIFRKN
jgi:ABC-type multidrug transport system ATPase subunit